MAKRVLKRRETLIPSAFLVRALARDSKAHHCEACGERMFVRYASGLCPQCFNGVGGSVPQGPVVEVPDGLALAGVLDDPSVEV